MSDNNEKVANWLMAFDSVIPSDLPAFARMINACPTELRKSSAFAFYAGILSGRIGERIDHNASTDISPLMLSKLHKINDDLAEFHV